MLKNMNTTLDNKQNLAKFLADHKKPKQHKLILLASYCKATKTYPMQYKEEMEDIKDLEKFTIKSKIKGSKSILIEKIFLLPLPEETKKQD